ncbi:hypothetical protein [Rhizobium sp.]
MSGDMFVAYFGLRFEIGADEVEALELRSDARAVAARGAGLKHFWGNFGGAREEYLLFIGEQIGILGYENSNEVSVSDSSLQLLISTTKRKLENAGFFDAPKLHLAWNADI